MDTITSSPALGKIAEQRYHWEDLPVGFRYSTSSRTITEADIVSFAALTADFNRAHVDDHAARQGPFGKRIAHGLLVVSYMAGLNTRTVVNQLLEPSLLGLLATDCRFLKPTFVGDTIRVDIEVVEARPSSKGDRGIVKFKRTAISQDGVALVECLVTMLLQRRTAA
jgi:acyl dehydratase